GDWCAEEFEGAPLDRGEAGEFLDLPPGEDDGLPVEGGQVIEQVPVAAGGQAVVVVTCPDPCGLGFQELAPGRAVARGAGSRPARLRMSRTVPGGTPIPAPASSPLTLWYPQVGFSPARRSTAARMSALVEGRPGRFRG